MAGDKTTLDRTPLERNKDKKLSKETDKLYVEQNKEIQEVTDTTKQLLWNFTKEQFAAILPLIDDDNILNSFEGRAGMLQFRKYRQMRATDMLEFGGSLGLGILLLTIQNDIGESAFVRNIVALYNKVYDANSLAATDLKWLTDVMKGEWVQQSWFKLVRMFSGRINNLLRDGINNIDMIDVPKPAPNEADSPVLSPEQLWVYQAWFTRFLESNRGSINAKANDFVDTAPKLSKKDIKTLQGKITNDQALNDSQKAQFTTLLNQKPEAISHALFLQGLFLWYIQDQHTITTNTTYETRTENITKEVKIDKDGNITVIKDNSNDPGRFSPYTPDRNPDGTLKITTTQEQQITHLLSVWVQWGAQLTKTLQAYVGGGVWVGLQGGDIVGTGGSLYTWVSQQIYKSLSASLTGVLWFVQWGITTGAALWINRSPKLNQAAKSGKAQANLVTWVGVWIDEKWPHIWAYAWISLDKMWGINAFVNRMSHVLHTSVSNVLIEKKGWFDLKSLQEELQKHFDTRTAADLAQRLEMMIKVSDLSSLSTLLNKTTLTDLEKGQIDAAIQQWITDPLLRNISTERRQDPRKMSFGGVIVSWATVAAAVAAAVAATIATGGVAAILGAVAGTITTAESIKIGLWSAKFNRVDVSMAQAKTTWLDKITYNTTQVNTIKTQLEALVWNAATVSFDEKTWSFTVTVGDTTTTVKVGDSVSLSNGKLQVIQDSTLANNNQIKIMNAPSSTSNSVVISADWAYKSESAPIQPNIADVSCRKKYPTFEKMKDALSPIVNTITWPTKTPQEVMTAIRQWFGAGAGDVLTWLGITDQTTIATKDEITALLKSEQDYLTNYQNILPKLHLLVFAWSMSKSDNLSDIYELYNQLLRYETVMWGAYLDQPKNSSHLPKVYQRSWAKHHQRLVNEFGDQSETISNIEQTNKDFISEMSNYSYQWYAQVDTSEVAWFTWHFNSLAKNPKATYGKTALKSNTFITKWAMQPNASFVDQFVNVKLSGASETYAKAQLQQNAVFANNFAQAQLKKIVSAMKGHALTDADKFAIVDAIKSNFFDKKDSKPQTITLSDQSDLTLDMSQSAYYMVGNHQCGSNQTFVYVPTLKASIAWKQVNHPTTSTEWNTYPLTPTKTLTSYVEQVATTAWSSVNVAAAVGKVARDTIINRKEQKTDQKWTITTAVDVETMRIETLVTITQDGKEWIVVEQGGTTYLVQVQTDPNTKLVSLVPNGLMYKVEVKTGSTYQVIFQWNRPAPIDPVTKQTVTGTTSQIITDTQRPKPIITSEIIVKPVNVPGTYASAWTPVIVTQRPGISVVISNFAKALRRDPNKKRDDQSGQSK